MPIRRILLIITATTLLTACTPLIDASSPTSATPAPSVPDTQAFELGEFDPEGDFELFDPCTEIPGETLAAAGLGEQLLDPYYDRDRSVMCTFQPIDPVANHSRYVLTGDRTAKERVAELDIMIAPETDSSVPEAYLHDFGGETKDECSAAVHTSRGRFVVKYGETLTHRSHEEICAIALDKLEDFHQLLGENNGNSHRL